MQIWQMYTTLECPGACSAHVVNPISSHPPPVSFFNSHSHFPLLASYRSSRIYCPGAMSTNKDLRWNATGHSALSGPNRDDCPRVPVELDHDVPMPDVPAPSVTRFDEHPPPESAGPLQFPQPRSTLSVDQPHVLTSALRSANPTIDLVSLYLSTHTRAARLRAQRAALASQNQFLQDHLTLQQSHFSFAINGGFSSAQLSSTVTEQFSQTEASHRRLMGIHYSSACGPRQDQYRKLLLDHLNIQQQYRRLYSKHRVSQYRLQQLVLQMAVKYVKSTPNQPIQAPGVGRSGPLVLHPVSPPQDPVRAQSATTHVPATLPPVGQPSPRLHSPIKRAQLPDTFADSTKVLDERALSDDLPPPPDLYYPPTPTMAPVSGDRPTDGDGNGNGCSSSSSGSPENTARSACQQLVGLVAIAASVRAIERNIPYDNGQRKCIICGEAFILSSGLTHTNFQVLLEHLRASHPKCLEKSSA